MLSFGQQKYQTASDATIKKLQLWILPTERRSAEETEKARRSLKLATTELKDMSKQNAKTVSYIFMALLALYFLSSLTAIITPILETIFGFATVISGGILAADLIYLAPDYVKLKLEDLEVAAKKTEPEAVIEEVIDDNTLQLDSDINNNTAITHQRTRTVSEESLVILNAAEAQDADNNITAKLEITGSTSPRLSPMST